MTIVNAYDISNATGTSESYLQALSRVQKLLKLAEHANTSVEEAANAASKAQEIMTRWKIERLMVSEEKGVSSSSENQEEIVNFSEKGAPLETLGRRLPTWKCGLAELLARANQCRTFLGYTNSGSRTIEIVGRPSDAETVRYLYNYISRECDRLTFKHGIGCGKTWCNNFRLGVVDAVKIKLKAERERVANSLREEAGVKTAVERGVALVLVNKALATIDRRDQETADWLEANLKLKNRTSGASRYDPSARAAGRAAGASISLSTKGPGLTAGRRALKG